MLWAQEYIGIPFKPNGRDRNGLDCWGLACLIYLEQKRISLPAYNDIFLNDNLSTLKKVARIMQNEKEQFEKVERPKAFDLVILRSGMYSWHVGVVIDKRKMIHVMSGIDSVVESFKDGLWANRIDSFRRVKIA